MSAPFGHTDRAPVDEESLKVAPILQWLENRPFEPALKVDGALHVVTEREMNAKVSLVLGTNDGWQEVHRRNLTQTVQSR